MRVGYNSGETNYLGGNWAFWSLSTVMLTRMKLIDAAWHV